jgi:cystathionine beta-lyase
VTYDFDVPINRKGSGCIKFDRRPELDPFWVADMDFASAPEIIENLHRRIDHGVFGYAQAHEALNDAIDFYLETQRGVKVPRGHITHLGGLVPALSLAGRAFCGKGEALMTCTPVYPPFINVHHDGVADLITVDHIVVDGLYTFDWDAMEKAVTPETKVFILCNPQNPLGRVFTAEEVTRLALFCQTHSLVLVSDEIHCDLVLDPAATPHFSALELPEELRQHAITLLSPSKTWNIAGLGYAFSVIPDDGIRRKFIAQRGHTLSEINALSYYAAEAAPCSIPFWPRRLRSSRSFPARRHISPGSMPAAWVWKIRPSSSKNRPACSSPTAQPSAGPAGSASTSAAPAPACWKASKSWWRLSLGENPTARQML